MDLRKVYEPVLEQEQREICRDPDSVRGMKRRWQ
jgi:hypothetical protein